MSGFATSSGITPQPPGEPSERLRDLEVEALVSAERAEQLAARLALLNTLSRVLVIALAGLYLAASVYAGWGKGTTVWMFWIGPWLAISVLVVSLGGIGSASLGARGRAQALRRAAAQIRTAEPERRQALAREIQVLRFGRLGA